MHLDRVVPEGHQKIGSRRTGTMMAPSLGETDSVISQELDNENDDEDEDD
jgi:hypothetical protein